MKRLISWLICLTLIMSLAVPVLGAEETEAEDEYAIDTMLPALDETIVIPVPEVGDTSLQEKLTEVILHVRKTLDIDDSYTDFYSDYDNSPSQTRWTLNWSDDSRQLSVTVTTEGRILNSYYWTENGTYDYFYGFDPVFPAFDKQQAQEQADQWLERLFTGEESGRIDSVRTYLGTNGYYRFDGTVEKNGLESPITFSMVIDKSGLSSFYRSDSYSTYVGDTPDNKPTASLEEGQNGLAGAVAMELYYVSDGEGNASLRYVPVGPYTIVDAQSGEAVDMDALYAAFDAVPEGKGSGIRTMDAAGEAEEAMADGGIVLTEAELASVESYGAVMERDALDEALRKIEALGLDGFSLQRCSYNTDSTTGTVTASLRYVAAMTEDQRYGFTAAQFAEMSSYGGELQITKYITMDAQTGALRSVYTSYPLWEKDEGAGLDLVGCIQAADAFLEQAAPEMMGEAALCTLKGYNQDDRIVFTRTHDGYFFPENYLTVQINEGSGTVDSFTYAWDEDVSFAGTKGIVNEKEAADAYIDALDVVLGYAAWPIGMDQAEAIPYVDYLNWGYTYVEELRLAYYYGGTDRVLGIDALTGEPVVTAEEADGVFSYTDLDDGELKDMIQALAGAGVGFEGGEFKPEAELTQRDAVTLLLQAGGMTTIPKENETLRRRACSEGFIAAEDWDPEATVTRMDFLKMLLGTSRYGDAAKLTGIWSMRYPDVDRQDIGYAAIANALGMVKDGRLIEPDKICTRGEAAEFLYHFMSR